MMAAMSSWLTAVPWQLLVAAVSAVIAVIAAVMGLRNLFSPPSEVALRLERTVGRAEAADDREHVGDRDERLLPGILRPIAWMVRPSKSEELSRLRQKLVHAGLRGPRSMEKFLIAKVLLATLVTVVFYQINGRVQRPLTFPLDIAAAVWLCGAGFFLPHIWLRSKAQARQLQISNAMPDAMDLMVTCVEAGLSLDAAISRVSQEIGMAAPILGSELNLTFLEIQAGVRRADAFRRLAERTGVEDLRSLSAMLIQTEIFGTSVSRALRVHSEGMRIRRMQTAEEKAAMVGVKMTFPLVLCILPALLAIVVGPAVVSILDKLMKAGS
jgi:tight adherence protein C